MEAKTRVVSTLTRERKREFRVQRRKRLCPVFRLRVSRKART